MTKRRVSREDLYAQVWATPMSRLAANYGISDVALAKTCKRMNVPRPGRGYWARLAAGQKTKRVPLPRLQASDETFGWLEDLAEPAQRAPREPRPEVPLPRDLRAASDAVREIGTALADAPNDSFNRLLLGNERDPAFAVSVASHRRALLLLDGLVKALEARGHRIELRREGDKPRLVVLLGQEQVALSMTERPERVEHTLTPDEEKRKASGYTYGIPKYDYVVGGNLQLRIGAAGFGDGKSRKLEQLLGSVVVAIEAEAAALAMRRRAEESKRSAEEERRRQAEAERERIQRHGARLTSCDAFWRRSKRRCLSPRTPPNSQSGIAGRSIWWPLWILWRVSTRSRSRLARSRRFAGDDSDLLRHPSVFARFANMISWARGWARGEPSARKR